MGILYEKVLKMRENGRSLKPTVVSEKSETCKKSNSVFENNKNHKETTNQKPKETAVKNDDERTGGKS